MPRYDYKCNKCDMIIEIVHPYKELVTNCPQCDSTDFNKVFFSPLNRVRPAGQSVKVGDEVNKAIEESRQDLEKQIKELQKNRSSS
jgi:putative FmdB family regulatory protein